MRRPVSREIEEEVIPLGLFIFGQLLVLEGVGELLLCRDHGWSKDVVVVRGLRVALLASRSGIGSDPLVDAGHWREVADVLRQRRGSRGVVVVVDQLEGVLDPAGPLGDRKVVVPAHAARLRTTNARSGCR